MTPQQSVNLTPAGAATLIQNLLLEVRSALDTDDLETALDSLVSALGLALQLGPAVCEQVLAEVVAVARELARKGDAGALSTLGPALVGLIGQAREVDALPPTAVMGAWADFALDLGALIGQVGVSLTIDGSHRAGMLSSARTRAALLDDITGDLFALASWLDHLRDDARAE